SHPAPPGSHHRSAGPGLGAHDADVGGSRTDHRLVPGPGNAMSPPDGAAGPAGASAARTVAAIVVNYNAADQLRACIQSLEDEGVGAILVVDNASSDDSEVVVASSAARWVETGSNRGYGAAANFGVAALADDTIEYLLVCNPDVVVRPGAIAALIERLMADPG